MSTSVHDCISFLLLILNLEKEISSKKKKKGKGNISGGGSE